MDLQPARDKVGEAHFFLAKMVEEERRTVGEHMHFSYYLSAFLTATMSIRDGVNQWKKGLEQEKEARLFDFMGKDRDLEVHGTGSRRTVGREDVETLSEGYQPSAAV
jgi:hypothetical protein